MAPPTSHASPTHLALLAACGSAPGPIAPPIGRAPLPPDPRRDFRGWISKMAGLWKVVAAAAPGLLSRLLTQISTATPFSTSQLSHQGAGSVWNLGPLNHVAIAVPDLEKAKAFYKNVLGAQVSEAVPLPEHGVTVVFVNLGNTKMELLQPLGPNSPIIGFLQKNKAGGIHHVCIEVDDINATMVDLKEKKIRTLSEKATIGAHGKPVIFLHPKDCSGVLVELEQA
ncbi:methylmalonyl-CoA epimerase, mitochondrial [Erinaceus europaeus]|uniref:Methylmalonyl-CoA epimerase, mitochondrial n=1 Tax=Erinaceus europaeus TaxID=9365 RepID=A0ABM3WFF0_ERIEU|nr:methylmalonyl-CoA epimerase, mitochondrial [Erinaceus europaeus]